MKTYRVDLHGMTVIESKIELNHVLDSLSWDYTDVLVVHGYHSHVLMDFVRNEYKHKRINLEEPHSFLLIVLLTGQDSIMRLF